ncbi:MAG TPA: cell division protein FtsQ/DivIB [Steroidobacteraceae bacterium]
MSSLRMSPLTRRNRRRATDLEPSLLERIDWRRVATGAGMLAGCALLAMLLALALDRPVRRVLVEGAFQRVSPPQVETAVTRVVHGGLTSVDLDAVREEVGRIPWVDGVIVQRRWPDAIRVLITEQVAAARWNDTGLLNTRGHLFIRSVRFVPPELPLLEGPEGSEGAVAQVYLDAQGRLLEAGLRLTGVRLDERGAWELAISDGLKVKLGRQAVNERLERFIALASPMVAKRLAEIAYVDMRYTNGFSVGWNGRSALAVAPTEVSATDG